MLIKMNISMEEKIMGIRINQSIRLHILTIANKDQRLSFLIQGLTLDLYNESPSMDTKCFETWHIWLGSTPSLFRSHMIKSSMRSAILDVFCIINYLSLEYIRQVFGMHHKIGHFLQCSILYLYKSILLWGVRN